MNEKAKQRIYKMTLARVYPFYIAKAEKKGRTKEEVDEIIFWLTGYKRNDFEKSLKDEIDLETFFSKAPLMNPSRRLINGLICGVRVEEINDSTVQNVRYLDKLIDELAKGRPMKKILRS